MKAVIHQPHFLPWLGYINKLANTDVFIIQDNVQFRRRYFQNRTIIRNVQNKPLLLSIPIHAKVTTPINEVIVVDSKWPEKFEKTLYHSYCKCSFYNEYASKLIGPLYSSSSLIEINLATLRAILEILNIEINILIASSFHPLGTPTEQLVSLCHQAGANEYIFGQGGGIEYHGVSMFKKHGIKVIRQDFLKNYLKLAHRYYPPKCNISIIDYIFNLGAEKTIKIIKECWTI